MDDQLNLPNDIVTRLIDAAQTEGTTPAAWLEQRLLTAECKRDKEQGAENTQYLTDERLAQMRKEGKTMLDLWGDYVGCIQSSGELRASERHSELFTEYLEQKHREGRL